jgi:hypothetical protein
MPSRDQSPVLPKDDMRLVEKKLEEKKKQNEGKLE